ncbi:MATE family efflux transporter [Flavonifractor sp. An4]|uniref:MATE family efflux transporter n=1 Tax=Flavonifractor sp. An4 TaxID=1965634 RepID=UPI000B385BAB|nr:MATE family efflux transporter [Flavonifractor sp. An4]OUO16859.1 MATE family efflux transporter [Flavonifractor sp. An4]
MRRTFFKYISLNMLGALGLSGYIMADTFFVANRLGSDGLAALNLAIPIFGLINGLGILLGIGGATRYSICRYQGDEDRGNRTFTLSLLTGLGLGIILALLGAFCARPIALLLGANTDTLPLCTVYLRTVLLFSPCFLLNHVMVCFVRNDGNPKLAMTAMLAGSLANIALDYLFLYPLNMGIFGAALATGTAPVIGLCLSSLHSLTGRNQYRLSRPANPARSLADAAGLGSAAFLNEFTSCMVLALYNTLMLRAAGTVGVAAYGVVANLALMALALFTGLSQGAQPLISQSYGRGDHHTVRQLCRLALLVSCLVGLALALIAQFGAEPLAALFNRDGDPELARLAVSGLRIYFWGFLFAGPNIIAASFLGAVEQPRASFLLSLFRGGIGIAALVLLLAWLLGVTGIWLAFPVTELLTLFLALGASRRVLRTPLS